MAQVITQLKEGKPMAKDAKAKFVFVFPVPLVDPAGVALVLSIAAHARRAHEVRGSAPQGNARTHTETKTVINDG